jgi:hypothetical protein
LPLMWNEASSGKISLSMKHSSSILNCISSQNSCLFTLSAGVTAYTNHILYGLKQSHLCNTFHTIFGMSNSLLALATDLWGLRWNASCTLSVLSSDTRGQPGFLPLQKHPVSSNCRCHLVTLFFCGASFINCAQNSTLHCKHRSGHFKMDHTESHLLLRCHFVNWPCGPALSMRSEQLVVNEKLGELPVQTVYIMPM